MRDPRSHRFAARIMLAAAGLIGAACIPTNGYADSSNTTTPIKHVIVIFQENVSFDHYFATYPVALNPAGEPPFYAAPGTPSVNGLGTLINGQPSGVLLTDNPNLNNPANNTANGDFRTDPFRLDLTQASTCDQDHNYGPEQQAFDQGLMDAFPAFTGVGENTYCAAPFAYNKGQGLTMGYFDGNTVTALWNYAQHFAMSDNFYGTTFGPSTPGMANLVAGNTYPATPSGPTPKVVAVNGSGTGTLVGDMDPTGDVCSTGTTVSFGGKNIGDLLNAKDVSWGAFMGGFDLAVTNPPNAQDPNSTTGCQRSSAATPANGGPTADYIPHHAFFQYWASTANPTHARPASINEIGHAGPANHEYDINDFYAALKAGRLPAVSFLKAIAADDGHAGYSDPLLEQSFLVKTINAVMNSPYWNSTAIFITWDDSDGWYDHQMGPIVNPSAVSPGATAESDQLNGSGKCGNGAPLSGIEGRCGHGPRIPLLLISPFAKRNFVDHTATDQSSIIRFIEDNWRTGRIGGGSFDQIAGPLNDMFNFGHAHNGFDFDHNKSRFGRGALLLNPKTGEPL